MYKVTRLIHLAPRQPDASSRAFIDEVRRALAGAERCLVEPTLPGSRNGGDILVHAQYAAEQTWSQAQPGLEALLAGDRVAHVDGVDYTAEPAPSSNPPGGVYRTLLVAVPPETAPEIVAAFESDLLLMPRYVRTIRAFGLSRPHRTLGASRWTHVFEQEFTDEAGLMGPYLMHPIHWARVDRWFDPECPEFIVRDRICHSYCVSDGPVVTA